MKNILLLALVFGYSQALWAQPKAPGASPAQVTVQNAGVKVADCNVLNFLSNTALSGSAGVCTLRPIPTPASVGSLQFVTNAGLFGSDASLTTDGSGNLTAITVSSQCTPSAGNCGDSLTQNLVDCADPGGGQTLMCAKNDGHLWKRAGGTASAQLLDTTTSPTSGDLTGTYPNPNLAPFGTAIANCGDATHVCQMTTDGKGRVQSALPVSIAGGGGGGGGANVFWDAPFGPLSDAATPPFITPALNTCVCTLFNSMGSFSSINGITYRVLQAGAESVQIGIYDINGAIQRFLCPAADVTCPGCPGSPSTKNCSNSITPPPSLPAGGYWFCYVGGGTTPSSHIALTPMYTNVGGFSTNAGTCGAGTLPTSFTNPVANFQNNQNPISFTMYNTGTTTTTVVSATTTVATTLPPTTTTTPPSGTLAPDWSTSMSGLIANYKFEVSGQLGQNGGPSAGCGGAASNCNLSPSGTVNPDTTAGLFMVGAQSVDFTSVAGGSYMNCTGVTCETQLSGAASGMMEIGGWFRDDTNPSVNTNNTVLMAKNVGANNGGYGLGRQPGFLRCSFSGLNGASTPVTGNVDATSGSWTTTDTTFHWGMCQLPMGTATTVKLYWDGLLNNSKINQAVAPDQGSQPFYVSFPATSNFVGHMDDVFVRFDSTGAGLDTAHIERIYACGIDGTNCTCNGSAYLTCTSNAQCRSCVGCSQTAICDLVSSSPMFQKCAGNAGLNTGVDLTSLACNAVAP